MSQEAAEKLLTEAFAYWINPEIERRRSAGKLGHSFELYGAQVIFPADGWEVEVRLNEEVRAVAQVRAARAIERGQAVTHDDIDEIEDIELTEQDPDSGHVTIILRPAGGWAISADLRRNATRIADHADAAREFIDAAAWSHDNNKSRPFIENIIAACELMARAFLIVRPDPTLLSAKSHNVVTTRFNLASQAGDVDPSHARLLNQAWQLRRPARYLSGELKLDSEDRASMLETARDMLARLEATSPISSINPN